MMNYSERSPNLKPEFYERLITFFESQSLHDLKAELETMGYRFTEDISIDALFNMVQEAPIKFLYYEIDIFNHPELLKNSFIEFDEDGELMDAGVTYFIDKGIAEEIAAKKAVLMIPRSGGDELFKIPYERLEQAFKEGTITIDYSKNVK
jgi:hypothetical protein